MGMMLRRYHEAAPTLESKTVDAPVKKAGTSTKEVKGEAAPKGRKRTTK